MKKLSPIPKINLNLTSPKKLKSAFGANLKLTRPENKNKLLNLLKEDLDL